MVCAQVGAKYSTQFYFQSGNLPHSGRRALTPGSWDMSAQGFRRHFQRFEGCVCVCVLFFFVLRLLLLVVLKGNPQEHQHLFVLFGAFRRRRTGASCGPWWCPWPACRRPRTSSGSGRRVGSQGVTSAVTAFASFGPFSSSYFGLFSFFPRFFGGSWPHGVIQRR